MLRAVPVAADVVRTPVLWHRDGDATHADQPHASRSLRWGRYLARRLGCRAPHQPGRDHEPDHRDDASYLQPASYPSRAAATTYQLVDRRRPGGDLFTGLGKEIPDF
ncbi:MAG: hypothetical protein ACR2HA_08125 [Nocardioides sp.]